MAANNKLIGPGAELQAKGLLPPPAVGYLCALANKKTPALEEG